MKQVLAIRHVHREALERYEDVLKRCGLSHHYITAHKGPLDFDPLAPDLLIVLGGPIGVYDREDFPFLKDEIKILEKRLAADLPTLGICLGSQLMAHALGSRVYKGPNGQEIGWGGLTLTAEGKTSPLRHLDSASTSMLHWHGDTFDLPQGAIRLASSAKYQNQAYRWGKNCLGVQFHPEVRVCDLEAWYINSAYDIAAVPGLTVPRMREEGKRNAPAYESQTEKFLEDWLKEIGMAAAS